MKKTLIALAAVAVSTGAMAQAHNQTTISGKLRFAYEATDVTTTGTKAKTSGIRVTDGDIVIRSTEDLGGGLKMSADMAIQSRGRVTAIAGRDAKLTLSGGFGSVMVGAIEAGNGILGLGGAGAPVYGTDGSVIAGGGNTDILRYTTPSMNGFAVFVSLLDAPGAGGMEAAALTQDARQIGFTYSAGPLRVAGDYVKASDNAATASTDTTLRDKRTRLSASYNLGVATVGAGYEVDTRKTSATATRKVKDTIIGVSAPLASNITVGLNYATSDSGVANAPKVKGTDIGVKYDLSKRSYIAFQYQTVDNRAGTTNNATSKNSKYRIQLAHSF